MKRRFFILSIFICLLLPLNVVAMKMDHASMNMTGERIPLGEVEVDGVKASATLLDVGKAMAEHGMKTTHHLMVKFTSVESGEVISKGRAATKVKTADGKESKAFMMMAMDEAFGTDLTLDQSGPYQFKVGTKLSDKKKRTFSFTFEE